MVTLKDWLASRATPIELSKAEAEYHVGVVESILPKIKTSKLLGDALTKNSDIWLAITSKECREELLKKSPAIFRKSLWAELDDLAEDNLFKTPWIDKLHGGEGDKKKPTDFPAELVAEGVAVEMEHTTDKHIATEIALDHLTEDIHYYKKLKTIEKDESIQSRLNKAEVELTEYLLELLEKSAWRKPEPFVGSKFQSPNGETFTGKLHPVHSKTKGQDYAVWEEDHKMGGSGYDKEKFVRDHLNAYAEKHPSHADIIKKVFGRVLDCPHRHLTGTCDHPELTHPQHRDINHEIHDKNQELRVRHLKNLISGEKGFKLETGFDEEKQKPYLHIKTPRHPRKAEFQPEKSFGTEWRVYGKEDLHRGQNTTEDFQSGSEAPQSGNKNTLQRSENDWFRTEPQDTERTRPYEAEFQAGYQLLKSMGRVRDDRGLGRDERNLSVARHNFSRIQYFLDAEGQDFLSEEWWA